MTQATQAIAEENPADEEFYGADDPAETYPEARPVVARSTVLPAEPPPSDAAPYGWMRDKDTPGGWRAKKAPGRPRNPPAADELAAREPIDQAADQPPGEGKRPGGRFLSGLTTEVAMPKAGLIAAGVDKLYRRAGKLLRVIDDDLGLALMECTRPDPDDPDVPTVGQAWENLARTNPRVRAWLLNLIKGGTWQDLLMAHAPIGVALMTKDWVRRMVPIGRAAEILLEPDEDTEPGDLRPADAHEMQQLAQQQAQRLASKMGVKVPPGVAEAALKEAERRAAAGEAPPGLARQQPRHASRAKRRGR